MEALEFVQRNWILLVGASITAVFYYLWKIKHYVDELHKDTEELKNIVTMLNENTPYCLTCEFKSICPRKG